MKCLTCGAEYQEATWIDYCSEDCQEEDPGLCEASEPLGQTLSRQDPHGVYTMDGERIGSVCNCEDYPCCGH